MVHAQHDRYVGHEVLNFPLNSAFQKQSPEEAKHHQDDMLCFSFTNNDNIKLYFLLNTPRVPVASPSNKLTIVTTVRLNL